MGQKGCKEVANDTEVANGAERGQKGYIELSSIGVQCTMGNKVAKKVHIGVKNDRGMGHRAISQLSENRKDIQWKNLVKILEI